MNPVVCKSWKMKWTRHLLVLGFSLGHGLMPLALGCTPPHPVNGCDPKAACPDAPVKPVKSPDPSAKNKNSPAESDYCEVFPDDLACKAVVRVPVDFCLAFPNNAACAGLDVELLRHCITDEASPQCKGIRLIQVPCGGFELVLDRPGEEVGRP